MNYSRLLALTLGSTLAILTPALAQDAKLAAPLTVEVTPGEGLVEVDHLVRTWARQTGRSAFVSPQVAALKVRLEVGEQTLERKEILGILLDHGVLLLESPTRLRAFQIREAQNRINSAQTRLYTEDQALPQFNTPVTLVYQVKHGAASAIYANLRGILARDPSRSGNILYVQGPERIFVSDLAPNVAYFRDILRSLDQPVVRPSQRVTVYEVSDSTWSRLRKVSGREAAAALSKLAAEGQVTLHDDARVHGVLFAFSRELKDAKGSQFQLDLRVYDPTSEGKASRPSPPRLSLSLTRQGEGSTRQSRRLQVVAPTALETTLVSAKLDLGETRTHLVVVLSPTP